ncbi:MAG: hypothetical protein FWB79_01160 [Treponema sp.]|nr:hypothetical protein [Treponema sp.]
MKKFVFAAVVLVFLFGGLPVFAQEEEQEQGQGRGLVYINVPLERIWSHRLGYVVQYRRSGNRVARAYLPGEWFAGGDARGELVSLPPGRSWPSMSVFFRDGEFSHVRLNVHRSAAHETWGIVPAEINIDNRFEGVEAVDLQF